MTDKFVDYPRLYGAPLMKAEDVKPLLRDPELHWKVGRSAFETSTSWVTAGRRPGARGIPSTARAVLDAAPEWAGAEVAIGFFEHATALDTQQGPSSTDILVVCRIGAQLGVLAVEGKAGETFGEPVSYWNTSPGRTSRLGWACTLLGVDSAVCGDLRWQLFHRTLSAVIEAKRFNATQAVMLVHDFSQRDACLDDFKAFAGVAGFVGAGAGRVSDPKLIDGVETRLAWVSDMPAG